MPTLRFGYPERPAVVLIHGIPGSPEGWRDVAGELAPDHYVLVPELLGFGGARDEEAILAQQQADALAGFLDAEGISKAAIVGHDFGGPIAMSLYEQRSDLFSHFCLLSTNAFPDTPIPFPLNTVTWPVLGNTFARLLFSRLSLKAMMRVYG